MDIWALLFGLFLGGFGGDGGAELIGIGTLDDGTATAMDGPVDPPPPRP